MIGGHLSPLPAEKHQFVIIETRLPGRLNDSRSDGIKAKTERKKRAICPFQYVLKASLLQPER